MEVIVAVEGGAGARGEGMLLKFSWRGRDVDVGSDVCDMENPLSRSEFLLKNLHTRELPARALSRLLRLPPCIHINVKINPECVFLRMQRMLNKQRSGSNNNGTANANGKQSKKNHCQW